MAKAGETRPDVALLDIGMPVLNGLEAAHQIIQSGSWMKILILTVHDSEAMIDKVLAVGARGFLFKTDAAGELVNAVKALQSDNTFFTAKVAEIVLRRFLKNGPRTPADALFERRLTPRQNEVIQLLAQGRSTKEVATLLNISAKTAETHRSILMRRLNCRSAAQLVRSALRNQIVKA